MSTEFDWEIVLDESGSFPHDQDERRSCVAGLLLDRNSPELPSEASCLRHLSEIAESYEVKRFADLKGYEVRNQGKFGAARDVRNYIGDLVENDATHLIACENIQTTGEEPNLYRALLRTLLVGLIFDDPTSPIGSGDSVLIRPGGRSDLGAHEVRGMLESHRETAALNRDVDFEVRVTDIKGANDPWMALSDWVSNSVFSRDRATKSVPWMEEAESRFALFYRYDDNLRTYFEALRQIASSNPAAAADGVQSLTVLSSSDGPLSDRIDTILKQIMSGQLGDTGNERFQERLADRALESVFAGPNRDLDLGKRLVPLAESVNLDGASTPVTSLRTIVARINLDNHLGRNGSPQELVDAGTMLAAQCISTSEGRGTAIDFANSVGVQLCNRLEFDQAIRRLESVIGGLREQTEASTGLVQALGGENNRNVNLGRMLGTYGQAKAFGAWTGDSFDAPRLREAIELFREAFEYFNRPFDRDFQRTNLGHAFIALGLHEDEPEAFENIYDILTDYESLGEENIQDTDAFFGAIMKSVDNIEASAFPLALALKAGALDPDRERAKTKIRSPFFKNLGEGWKTYLRDQAAEHPFGKIMEYYAFLAAEFSEGRDLDMPLSLLKRATRIHRGHEHLTTRCLEIGSLAWRAYFTLRWNDSEVGKQVEEMQDILKSLDGHESILVSQDAPNSGFFRRAPAVLSAIEEDASNRQQLANRLYEELIIALPFNYL